MRRADRSRDTRGPRRDPDRRSAPCGRAGHRARTRRVAARGVAALRRHLPRLRLVPPGRRLEPERPLRHGAVHRRGGPPLDRLVPGLRQRAHRQRSAARPRAHPGWALHRRWSQLRPALAGRGGAAGGARRRPRRGGRSGAGDDLGRAGGGGQHRRHLLGPGPLPPGQGAGSLAGRRPGLRAAPRGRTAGGRGRRRLVGPHGQCLAHVGAHRRPPGRAGLRPRLPAGPGPVGRPGVARPGDRRGPGAGHALLPLRHGLLRARPHRGGAAGGVLPASPPPAHEWPGGRGTGAAGPDGAGPGRPVRRAGRGGQLRHGRGGGHPGRLPAPGRAPSRRPALVRARRAGTRSCSCAPTTWPASGRPSPPTTGTRTPSSRTEAAPSWASSACPGSTCWPRCSSHPSAASCPARRCCCSAASAWWRGSAPAAPGRRAGSSSPWWPSSCSSSPRSTAGTAAGRRALATWCRPSPSWPSPRWSPSSGAPASPRRWRRSRWRCHCWSRPWTSRPRWAWPGPPRWRAGRSGATARSRTGPGRSSPRGAPDRSCRRSARRRSASRTGPSRSAASRHRAVPRPPPRWAPRIDAAIRAGEPAPLLPTRGPGGEPGLALSDLPALDGPVSVNPVGVYEGAAYRAFPRHSDQARFNSFNAGELLFPGSRWSLVPLLLLVGGLLYAAGPAGLPARRRRDGPGARDQPAGHQEQERLGRVADPVALRPVHEEHQRQDPEDGEQQEHDGPVGRSPAAGGAATAAPARRPAPPGRPARTRW